MAGRAWFSITYLHGAVQHSPSTNTHHQHHTVPKLKAQKHWRTEGQRGGRASISSKGRQGISAASLPAYPWSKPSRAQMQHKNQNLERY